MRKFALREFSGGRDFDRTGTVSVIPTLPKTRQHNNGGAGHGYLRLDSEFCSGWKPEASLK